MSGCLEAVEPAGRAEERVYQATKRHVELGRDLYVSLRVDGFDHETCKEMVRAAITDGSRLFDATIDGFCVKYQSGGLGGPTRFGGAVG